MSNAIEWIKEHPVLSIIGGLVVILVFFALRRSSSGGSTVASSGPSESLQALGIQAGTQLQMYQIAAGVEMQKTDAALAAFQLQQGVDLTKTQYALQYGLASLGNQNDMYKYGIDAQLTYGLASLGYFPGQPIVQNPATPPTVPVVSGGYSGGSGSGSSVGSGLIPAQGSYTQVGSQLYGPSPFLDQEYCGGIQDVNSAYACSLRNQSRWETYMTPLVQAEQNYQATASQLGPGNWVYQNGQWVNTV